MRKSWHSLVNQRLLWLWSLRLLESAFQIISIFAERFLEDFSDHKPAFAFTSFNKAFYIILIEYFMQQKQWLQLFSDKLK